MSLRLPNLGALTLAPSDAVLDAAGGAAAAAAEEEEEEEAPALKVFGSQDEVTEIVLALGRSDANAACTMAARLCGVTTAANPHCSDDRFWRGLIAQIWGTPVAAWHARWRVERLDLPDLVHPDDYLAHPYRRAGTNLRSYFDYLCAVTAESARRAFPLHLHGDWIDLVFDSRPILRNQLGFDPYALRRAPTLR